MGTVEKGKTGEEKATKYLKRKGFEILFRNYRYGHKEIDIIARDKKYIVFVEVKAGKSRLFGPPQGWVDIRKQKKIAEVAKYFLHRHKFPGYDFRFDVVAIEENPSQEKIEHIENAFYLD